MNSLKHGLRAKTLVLPGEDPHAYQQRLDTWTGCLQPRDEVEQYMDARAVHASWNLERVDRARAARRDALRYADADRLAEQAEQVTALGRRLLWDPNGPLCLYPHAAPANGDTVRVSWSGDPADPDDPARLVVRLESTALGCAWLLERWAELRELLEDGLSWQAHDRLKAIRLLGRQPLEATDDQRVMAIYLCCWAMEPGSAHGFTDMIPELTPKERPVYLDRLNAREPMAHLPEGPDAARADLLGLIAEEEDRLEAALAGHLEREEAQAAAEQAFDESAYGERLRRYEQSNDRTLLRIVETLRKRHQDADGTVSPGGRAAPRGRGCRDTRGTSTGSDPHPGPVDPGWLGSEAAPAAAAPRGGAEAGEAGPAGVGAGLAAGWTPGTQIAGQPIGADPQSASPAWPVPEAAGIPSPEAIESPGDSPREPVAFDSGGPAAGPAGSPPTVTAGADEWEEDGLTAEEIEARLLQIAQVLGLYPETPSLDRTDEVAPVFRSREREGEVDPEAEPFPSSDPHACIEGKAPPLTHPGSVGFAASPPVDWVERTPMNESSRTVVPARRLSDTVLALFALVSVAGLPAASAHSRFRESEQKASAPHPEPRGQGADAPPSPRAGRPSADQSEVVLETEYTPPILRRCRVRRPEDHSLILSQIRDLASGHTGGGIIK
jgi:hypothetical protein